MKKLALLVLLAMSLIMVGCDDDDEDGGLDNSFAPSFNGGTNIVYEEHEDGSSYWLLEVYVDVTQEMIDAYEDLLANDPTVGGYTYDSTNNVWVKETGDRRYVVSIDYSQGRVTIIKESDYTGETPTSISISPKPTSNLNMPVTYSFTYTPAGSHGACTTTEPTNGTFQANAALPQNGPTSWKATIGQIGGLRMLCGGQWITVSGI